MSGWTGQCRDWTAGDDDQRLRELQARARSQSLIKDRYVAIFESLRHPAFVFDKNHRLIHANKAASDLFIGEGEAGDTFTAFSPSDAIIPVVTEHPPVSSLPRKLVRPIRGEAIWSVGCTFLGGRPEHARQQNGWRRVPGASCSKR